MARPTDPALEDRDTGLSNEKHFAILYDFAFAACDRGIPLALALLEVDPPGIAAMTDESGRWEVLRELGLTLGESTRDMDVSAHLGDGRFLFMLMDCNLQGGRVFADRIRGRAEDVLGSRGLTVSVGLAAYREEMEEGTELLAAARAALEAASEAGGDRVVIEQEARSAER